MIGSFKHRGLKRFFERDDPRRLPPDMKEKIRLILGELNTAEVVEDLNVHSFNLHPLTGDRQDEWSITVRANWRITFRFEQGLALDLNFEAYHERKDVTMKKPALKMKNPPHPGLGVRVGCLEPYGLTITEGAKILGRRRERRGPHQYAHCNLTGVTCHLTLKR